MKKLLGNIAIAVTIFLIFIVIAIGIDKLGDRIDQSDVTVIVVDQRPEKYTSILVCISENFSNSTEVDEIKANFDPSKKQLAIQYKGWFVGKVTLEPEVLNKVKVTEPQGQVYLIEVIDCSHN